MLRRSLFGEVGLAVDGSGQTETVGDDGCAGSARTDACAALAVVRTCYRRRGRAESRAATASASHRLFSGWSACPRTQWNRTSWTCISRSSRCHRSRFLTGFFEAVRQFLAFHCPSHCSRPVSTYFESEYRSTRLGLFSVESPSMTADSSMRLLVVAASPPEHSFSDPLTPWRRMYAHPPGPGFPEQAPSVYNWTWGRWDTADYTAPRRSSRPPPANHRSPRALSASRPGSGFRYDARMGQVVRIEVRSRPEAGDPLGDALLGEARAIGLRIRAAATAKVYLIQANLDSARTESILAELLVDRLTETATLGASPPGQDACLIEVHPLPGVMDPAAQSVSKAIADLLGIPARVSTGMRYDLAGIDADQARSLASRLLANPVIHAVHEEPFHPDRLPEARPRPFNLTHVPIRDLDAPALERLSRTGHLFLSLEEMQAIRAHYRALGRDPTDIELETLAQTWSEHCVHKTLKSVVRYERGKDGETKRRSDAETKRRREEWEVPDPIDFANRPGHTLNPDGSVTIDNLLGSTIAAVTHELIADGVDWCLSVFKDNAGVIAFDDRHAICVKVETHNHPSAIEPYGGAATGAVGCIRDIIGTGLAAKPIASTDVFCVAFPDAWGRDPGAPTQEHESADGPAPPATSRLSLPAGCLHPRRILTQIVAGVRDYGNRMGIPTVNGAVAFDDRYVGNPLVFCGCVGIMPRDRVKGRPNAGDRIIAMGGRTGRDGIHVATFSSAELTDTHADEFSHAVQIGNPIEQKRLLDAILRAAEPSEPDPAAAGAGQDSPNRLRGLGKCPPLFSAITDCGAGGFSSAIGEMGEHLGALVHLDRAPLKYPGLTHTEIWISEAQERMILAVPPENVEALSRICAAEHVELADLGAFGTPDGDLILRYDGAEVGRIPMEFLHGGLPRSERRGTWPGGLNAGPGETNAENAERFAEHAKKDGERIAVDRGNRSGASSESCRERAASREFSEVLLQLLAHPDIASKHWIIRQYDHEVQGATSIKPLVGPLGAGPGDAAVLEPVPGSGRGLAIGCGLATPIGDPRLGGDPYFMALAAIDECVRNLVCVGADPERIAILDNFCWPGCDRPEHLGALVRTCEGCADGARAYRTPFISGKDSLNNQFRTQDGGLIEIPYTLLITGVGIAPRLDRCVTSDAKRAGNGLILVGRTCSNMGGSTYEHVAGAIGRAIPTTDLTLGPRIARRVHGLIREGIIRSAHDVSDGGLLVALAEMFIGACDDALGADLDLSVVHADAIAAAFSESPSRYVLEVGPDDMDRIKDLLVDVPWTALGRVTDTARLCTSALGLDISVGDLFEAWRRPLDW